MSIDAQRMFLLQATPSWVIAMLATSLVTGLFLLSSDRRARQQPPLLRVPAPPDAAPVWIGLGVMLLFYVYVPVALGMVFREAPGVTTMPTRHIAQAIWSGILTYLSAILAGVLIHLYMRSPAKRFLGLARPTSLQWRLLLSVSLASIPLTYLTSGATSALLDAFGWEHPTSHPMLDWMSRLADRPDLKWAAIVSATVLAPVFEELFFRGHLQTALVGMLPNKWVGIALASFLFASLHPWWTIPAIFVLSLCLGALYERTNNLWMPMALHIAFNATSTAVFLGKG